MRIKSLHRTQWDPEKLELRSCHRLKIDLTELEGGLRVEIPFFVLVGETLEPRVLVIAGVHGDEYEGVAALQDLAKEINPKKLGGTLILVPVANPQAFYAGTRRNPVDLGDLNRSFPGKPDGTLSERLARNLFQEIVPGNDCILSMHSLGKEATVIPYVEYPEGKNEVCRKSYAAARALGLEFLHPYNWHPGLLVAAAIRCGIPAIEAEVGSMGTLTAEGQSIYRDLVYRLLLHLRMLQPGNDLGKPPCLHPKIIGHCDLFASYAGLFRSCVSLGKTVGKGELLGTIHGLGGECLEELRAPRPGIVGILRTFCSVQPEDHLFQLFWEAGSRKKPGL